MKIYQKYIIVKYLKNFFIVLFALELFYVGIDLLTTYQKLPKSANLQILYIMFQSMYAINYVLPLSVIFAMIITVVSMVKTNELVSMLSFGISKQQLIKPLFITSVVITIFYIFLNFTSFAYAREYSNNILKFGNISSSTEDLLLKNNENYVYFKKLNPIEKKATDIKIFKVKNRDLVSIIEAKEGYYKGKNWILYKVKKITKSKVLNLDSKGLSIEKFSKIEALKDFRPKIIDNVYKGKFNLSILDAIDALKFFNSQDLDTNRLRTIILSQIFLPLFAPLLCLVFFSRIPLISRYNNTILLSTYLAFISIFVWGILFLLSKLALNAVIYPELAIIFPIVILGVVSLNSYYKKQ